MPMVRPAYRRANTGALRRFNIFNQFLILPTGMTSLKKSSLHGLSKIVFILSLMFVNPFHGFGADPDFAFPEKVEKTAASDLRAAVKDGDGKGAVNAMIRLGLAKAQVNTDSLPAVLRQVADLTAAETDPAAKALLNALSAKIYTQVYTSDRWTYDRREPAFRKWKAGISPYFHCTETDPDFWILFPKSHCET